MKRFDDTVESSFLFSLSIASFSFVGKTFCSLLIVFYGAGNTGG